MLKHRSQSQPCPAPSRRQRGAMLLLLALLLLISGSWLGLRMLNSLRTAATPDLASLTEAKNAVIAVTMQATLPSEIIPPVSSPGRLPPPDSLDPGEVPANYDGNVNFVCARSTWVPGATLVIISASMPVDIRCFGRLPWLALGLGRYAGVPQNDPNGVVPWYAVSANLATRCVRQVNPSLLNTVYLTFTGNNCGSVAQPYPWLTVLDAKGNLVTNRAAAVFILPGPPVGGQNRTVAPLAGPAAYLDTVTVSSTCTTPCVPGTYNNARFNWPNNIGLTFIQCALPQVGSANNPDYAQPYNCNDRLTYITIDELIDIAERRAMQYAAERLRAYYSLNGYFPNAARLGGDGSCFDPGSGIDSSGFISRKFTKDACPRLTHARFDTDSLPGEDDLAIPGPPPPYLPGTDLKVPIQSWFVANGWEKFLYYQVAADCTYRNPAPAIPPRDAQTSNCGATGGGRLASGARSNARVILVGTGAEILTPPYASKGAAQNRSAAAIPPPAIADYLDSIINISANDPLATTYRRFDSTTTSTTRNYNDKILVVAP